MRTNGACAAIMCVVASLFLTCAQEPEPSNCTSCSTLMELSVCTADVNRACCRQGGCESGEPSTCDLGCSSVLLPMSRACAGFLDANYGLLAIQAALGRAAIICEASNPPTGCDGQPCLNGATCTASGGIHTCACASGWVGADCSRGTAVAPLPHLLRATCSEWRRVRGDSQPPPPRAGAAMWQDGTTGELLLFGGWGQVPNASRGEEGERDDLWRLQTTGQGGHDDADGKASARWLRVGPNSGGGGSVSWPSPRAHAMPYTDATGKHYLLGGTAAGTAQADLWILNSGSSRWVQQHPKDWTPDNDWPAHTLEELVLSSELYTAHSWPMQRSRGTITALTVYEANRPDQFLLFGGAAGFDAPSSRALPLSDLWHVGRDSGSNTVSQFTYVGPPQKPGYVATPDLVGQPRYDAHNHVIGKFSWPGSRAGHGAWMDAVGNLIIFGGIGQITRLGLIWPITGSCGYRPDVWMWNGATGMRFFPLWDPTTHLRSDAVWRRMQERIKPPTMWLQPIPWDNTNMSTQIWQLPGVQHQRHRDQQACKSAWDADGGRRGLRPQPHTFKGAAVSAPPRAPPPSPSSAVPLPVGYAAATPSSLWLMSDRVPPPFVTGWGGPRLVVDRIRRKTDNQQHSNDEWDIEANPIVSCGNPNGTRTPGPRRADFAVVASSSHVVGNSQHRAEWMPTNGFVMFGGVDSSEHGNMSLSNELWIFEEQGTSLEPEPEPEPTSAVEPPQPCTAGAMYMARQTAMVSACCPVAGCAGGPTSCDLGCKDAAIAFFRDCDATITSRPALQQQQLNSFRALCQAH
jgi:hypothetical protein